MSALAKYLAGEIIAVNVVEEELEEAPEFDVDDSIMGELEALEALLKM